MALMLIVLVSTPFFVKSATVAELQEMIANLMQQLAAMQGQSSNCTDVITVNLGVGSRGDQVNALQQFLINQGFLNSNGLTGYFDTLTKASVIKLQLANGINSTGYVGPETRAKINLILCTTTSTEVSYTDATWTCQNGVVRPASISSTSCKTSSQWRAEAERSCMNNCATTNSLNSEVKCGVSSFSVAGSRCDVPTPPTINYCRSDLEMVWDKIGNYERRDPYTYQNDTCDGYRQLNGNEISSACFNARECAVLGSGTCVNIAEAKVKCRSTGQDPVINGVSGPVSLKVGEKGTWTVNVTAPAGAQLSYSVDWGVRFAATSAGWTGEHQNTATFTHSYPSAGTYTVTFSVMDAQKGANGTTVKTSMTVVVGGGQTTGGEAYIEGTPIVTSKVVYGLPNSSGPSFVIKTTGVLKSRGGDSYLSSLGLYLQPALAFMIEEGKGNSPQFFSRSLNIDVPTIRDKYGSTYYVLKEGVSVPFTYDITYDVNQMHAGSYYAELNRLYYKDNMKTDDIKMPSVGPYRSSTVTVVGEKGPWIRKATVYGGETGFSYTLSGERFSGNSVVYVDEKFFASGSGIVVSADGKILSFGTNNLSSGNHRIFVENPTTGRSNPVYLNVNGTVPVTSMYFLSPKAGEVLTVGKPYNFAWGDGSADGNDVFSISYSSENGKGLITSSWTQDQAGCPGAGKAVCNYSWTPTEALGQTQIHISKKGESISSDYFNVSGSVVSGASITKLNSGLPNGLMDSNGNTITLRESLNFRLAATGGIVRKPVASDVVIQLVDQAGNLIATNPNFTLATMPSRDINAGETVGVTAALAIDRSVFPKTGWYRVGITQVTARLGDGSTRIFSQGELGGGYWSMDFKVILPAVVPATHTCQSLATTNAFDFNACATRGFTNVCFNKITGVSRGCFSGQDQCVINNADAANNIACPVSSAPVSQTKLDQMANILQSIQAMMNALKQ